MTKPLIVPKKDVLVTVGDVIKSGAKDINIKKNPDGTWTVSWS
ncbi:hypothetical protein [Thalassospira alkalitolerans]